MMMCDTAAAAAADVVGSAVSAAEEAEVGELLLA